MTGKEFDVDKYLALSGLEALTVFRRGEPRFASSPEGARNDFSGFNVEVSDASSEGVSGQIDDALTFLDKNGEALRMLRSAPGVDDIRLDFPWISAIDGLKIVSQFDYFPPELVALAGALRLGIEISVYSRDLKALASRAIDGRPALQSEPFEADR